MSKVPKQTIYQIIGFALIALITLIAYAPSLLHCPRADQITYFAEIGNRQSWVDLAVNTYNLNRHRQFCPGDELLFRPVIYFLLGTEKYLFHYNFLLWQLVGVALHLGVLWCLLRLLLTIHLSRIAVAFTAIVGIAYINMEMVIWQHINGYMIFVMCLLIALRQWFLLLKSNERLYERLIIFVISVLIGSFTYEVMNIYGVLMAVSLLVSNANLRRYRLLLLLPVICYTFASLADMVFIKASSWEVVRIMHESGNIGRTIYNIGWTIWFWFFTTFFAVQLPIDLIARNVINAQSQSTMFMINWQMPATIGSVLLLMWLVGLMARQTWREWSTRIPFIILLMIMLVAYAAIIVVGRANSRGMWDILRVDLYYQYLFVVLGAIAIYVAIVWQKVMTRVTKWVGCALIAAFVLTNAYQLYWSNMLQAEANQPIITLISTLEELVKEKSKEADLSFYVDPSYPGNYVYEEIKNKDNPSKQYSLIEALYPQYFRPKGEAKYSFLPKT